jgi:copper chaperone CopZ
MKQSIILILLIAGTLFGKEVQDSIMTSAICEECKEIIEKKLKKTKGVISSNVNFTNGMLDIKFDDEKITKQDIKQAIAEVGYNADEVERKPKAYAKLPRCCKVKE